MEILFFVSLLAVLFILGYCVMKKLDLFMRNNARGEEDGRKESNLANDAKNIENKHKQ